MPVIAEVDNGKEQFPTLLIRGILPSLIRLVAALIIQLWINEEAEPASWEMLATVALTLEFFEEPRVKNTAGNLIKPDFMIRGIDPSSLGGHPLTKTVREKINIAAIDSKNSSNSEKKYGTDEMSKDDYITELLILGKPLK